MGKRKSAQAKLAYLKERTADTVKLEDLPSFPHMTGWFNPKLLGKLLLNVVVSDLFGQYADRRLIEAALDPDKRGKMFDISESAGDHEKSIWIDYVADLGDGFDATYSIAYLLAQSSLTIGKVTLPRGSALFFGGDEVYPTAERDDYIIKLRKPYEFARPQIDDDKSAPRVFALPGNHDWYDGLVVFLAMFCRERRTRYGNWGSIQRRSYFSVKLTEKWWLWGIDIALIRDMDQPQADYFVHAASNIPEGSNIILCSAEPGWYSAAVNGDAYRTLGYASSLARKADRKLHIPLVLSGDTHHYARYFGADTQFVTSGGGGAYLTGTQDLKPEIPIRWYHHQKETPLALQAAYPSKEESHRLLGGNFRFFKLNPGFSYTLGVLYWLLAFILTSLWRPDVGVIEYLLLFCGFFSYSWYQEKTFSWSTFFQEALHSAAHFGAIWLLSAAALWLYPRFFPQVADHWFFWALALLVIVPIGAHIAAYIFGLNLYLTCRYFARNNNDAFSAMKLDSHRHFIRMHIESDTLTLYPIGIDRVPGRSQWRMNPKRERGAPESVFIADPPLAYRFIEEPVVIRGAEAPSTEEIRPAPDSPETPAQSTL
jgi:hypothetical protein